MTTLLNLNSAALPTDGQVLAYDAASKKWLPANPPSGGSGSATWDSITGKPAVIAAGATAAEARTAIGAGTSSFSGAYADLSGKPTLGTAAAAATGDFATAAQGAKADAAIPSGLVDAKGDLIVATADNTVTRLPAGSNGHVLTADSGEAAGVKWAAAAGGGGGGFVFPIDATPLDPTYGDHFTGASLDAKWTRVNVTSADEAYQQGANGSHLRVNLAGGAAFRGYTQPVPAGDVEVVISFAQRSVHVSPPIFGLAFLASDDSGQGMFTYNNPTFFSGSINAGGAYGKASGSIGGGTAASTGTFEGQRIWLRVRRIGSTTDYASSLDGETWHVHDTLAAFAIAKVGIVRVFNSPATHIVHIDRFNMRSI